MNRPRVRRWALLAWLCADDERHVFAPFAGAICATPRERGGNLKTRSGEAKGRVHETRQLVARGLVGPHLKDPWILRPTRRGRKAIELLRLMRFRRGVGIVERLSRRKPERLEAWRKLTLPLCEEVAGVR